MRCINVQVPGKYLLTGEYAVMQGAPAIATTVAAYVKARIKAHDVTVVHSSLWEKPAHPSEHPLIDACFNHFMYPKCEVELRTEFDLRYGLGSSSGILLGLVKGLALFTETELSDDQLWHICWQIQKNYQSGFASGYDIAAQLKGGAGFFYKQCFEPLDIDFHRRMKIYVGGTGSHTKDLVKNVVHDLDQQKLWPKLIEKALSVHEISLSYFGREAIHAEEQAEFFREIKNYREILETSPHYSSSIVDKLKTCSGYDQDWQCKLCGAGGEDAILLFGEDTRMAESYLIQQNWIKLPYPLSSEGLTTWQST
jgi:mevalonate kinase